MSEGIVKHEQHTSALEKLPINGMNDLVTLGDYVAKSGMLGASTPAAGLMIAATCMQEGISLLEFGRRHHIDSYGKVTMRSDRMLADYMAMGGTCKWVTAADDTEKQTGLFTYGINVDYEVTFSYSEAEKAGYVKGGSNWEKDPAAQMRARVITRGVRMVCPAAVAGSYTPEEMQDVYSTDATPAQPAAMDPEKASQVVSEAAGTTQQKEVVVEAEVVEPFESEPDYNLCPMEGTLAGTPWKNMSIPDLQAAHQVTHPAMKQGHYDAIAAILKQS